MAWSLPGAALPEASARLPTQLKCPHPAQVSSPGGRPQGEQLMSAFPSRQPRRDVLLGGSRELKSSRNPNTSGRASVTPYEAPTHRLMERGDTFGAFSQQNHPPRCPVLLSALLCCLSSAANVLSSVWASPPPGSWVLALPLFLRTALSLPARGRLYVLSAVRPPHGACVPGFHQSLCHVTSGDRW